MGPEVMIFVFWMLTFKPAFSLSSFTFIKRLLVPLCFLPSGSGWCHLHIWGYWYFSWQSGFQLVLHSAPHFSCWILHKLNKQGDNKQPWCIPFPTLNQSFVPWLLTINYCLLTCIQVSQEADTVVWYYHLSKNFPQFVVIHTVEGFSIVSEAEVDVFLEFSFFFCDSMDVGNSIWSLLPLTLLNPAWTSRTSQIMYCWSLMWRIWNITLLACEMSAIAW